MFSERSFVGNKFSLPKPEIYFESQENLLVVATPWGPRSSARKAIQTIVDYYLSSKSDDEATSPFKRLTNLSSPANNLRIAVLLANESLYREDNKDEYRSGIELFAAARNQNELVWIQVGHPNVLLNRRHRSLLLPFSMQLDLSDELGTGEVPLPPVPVQLLGVDANPNIFINSFRPQEEDSLVLVSRSWLPEELLSVPHEKRDLEQLSHTLASGDDHPFWLGIWKI